MLTQSTLVSVTHRKVLAVEAASSDSLVLAPADLLEIFKDKPLNKANDLYQADSTSYIMK